MTRLGQHFLKNKSIVKKIAGALEIKSGDFILEVGPGHGELTAALASANADAVPTIIAVEKDASLKEPLITRFSGIPSIDVREGDILKVLPGIAREKPLSEHEWKLAGNIPYYITGKLLRLIGDLENKPTAAALMVQSEVAERICAEPPKMNRLAASIQIWADTKIIARVPKEDFSPAPKVDSAVVLLSTKNIKPDVDLQHYYKIMHILFAQPRKTILNNLAQGDSAGRTKEKISQILMEIGVLPEARPQNLAASDIVLIAKAL